MSLSGDLEAFIVELADLLMVAFVTFGRGLVEPAGACEDLFKLPSRVGLADLTHLELALLIDIMRDISVMEQIRWLLISQSMV